MKGFKGLSHEEAAARYVKHGYVLCEEYKRADYPHKVVKITCNHAIN